MIDAAVVRLESRQPAYPLGDEIVYIARVTGHRANFMQRRFPM